MYVHCWVAKYQVGHALCVTTIGLEYLPQPICYHLPNVYVIAFSFVFVPSSVVLDPVKCFYMTLCNLSLLCYNIK